LDPPRPPWGRVDRSVSPSRPGCLEDRSYLRAGGVFFPAVILSRQGVQVVGIPRSISRRANVPPTCSRSRKPQGEGRFRVELDLFGRPDAEEDPQPHAAEGFPFWLLAGGQMNVEAGRVVVRFPRRTQSTALPGGTQAGTDRQSSGSTARQKPKSSPTAETVHGGSV